MEGRDGSDYALGAEDIGSTIRAEATQTFHDGRSITVFDQTGPVRKADAEAPEKVEATTTVSEVNVSEPISETNEYEYSLDGLSWQNEPLFENLKEDTEYTVYARRAETETHRASEPASVTVKTDRIRLQSVFIYGKGEKDRLLKSMIEPGDARNVTYQGTGR